ncbi:MAG: pilus assembly protein PilM [Planctomycetes bacterium]|jgi:type IV pilus assembly protein PilM|nr:pilus assembly protein PilM [Planctomycetota bacterium]
MIITKSGNFAAGLDISDLTLKLVQLKKIRDKIKIQALNKISLPANIMDKGEIKNEEGLLAGIAELFARPKYGALTTNMVNVSLPDTKTFIKLIEIDKSPNPLPDIIRAEIEKYIPLPLKDIYYDWQVISATQDKYHVLIGASPKNIVDQYIEILRRAKLAISALEIESVAICRALLNRESPKSKETLPGNCGIIDIGAKRSNMIIYAQNTIVLSMSMPIAGDEITNRIATSLEIKRDQAEKAKIICGLDKDKAQGIICDILSDMINDLIHRIKETIDFYTTHYPTYGQLQAIYLCGGGSNIKNIENIISHEVNIKTTLADIFTHITADDQNLIKHFSETHSVSLAAANLADKDIARQNSALSFATAIGLSLRDIFINK